MLGCGPLLWRPIEHAMVERDQIPRIGPRGHKQHPPFFAFLAFLAFLSFFSLFRRLFNNNNNNNNNNSLHSTTPSTSTITALAQDTHAPCPPQRARSISQTALSRRHSEYVPRHGLARRHRNGADCRASFILLFRLQVPQLRSACINETHSCSDLSSSSMASTFPRRRRRPTW